jgi:intracellular multiplication protein IcmQ
MTSSHDKIRETAEKVYKALQQAVEQGPWQATTLLKAVGKELKSLQDRFQALLVTQDPPSSATSTKPCTTTEVFISLYQAQGENLSTWQNLLTNLSKLWFNRPVYQKESDARTFLNRNSRTLQHAYVAITVNLEDILEIHDNHSVDRLGLPLITLKETAVKPENIIKFVHGSGEYKWLHNFLVKEP